MNTKMTRRRASDWRPLSLWGVLGVGLLVAGAESQCCWLLGQFFGLGALSLNISIKREASRNHN
jgi:hypothetical protein